MFDVLLGASPIIYAALGALLTELAGSLCIAIEGFMIFGSFFSWAASYWIMCFIPSAGAAIALGTTCAVLFTAVAGWVLAHLVEKFRANPFVFGLAFNLFAGGAAASISASVFDTRGALRNNLLQADIDIPAFIAALLVTALLMYVIRGTTTGLALRSAGLSAEGAAERGIDTRRYRIWTWTCAAALAAFGGAALTWSVGSYVPGGVGARAWIALALVFLGLRKPAGVALAGILITLLDGLVMTAQRTITGIPLTALLGIPQLAALAAYALCAFLSRRTCFFSRFSIK